MCLNGGADFPSLYLLSCTASSLHDGLEMDEMFPFHEGDDPRPAELWMVVEGLGWVEGGNKYA